uniref:Uncharacterized protein n=1 Tax=Cacopsylla melanoneura TaxID=428564 RepID=A0A8D8RWV1_9HEMI
MFETVLHVLQKKTLPCWLAPSFLVLPTKHMHKFSCTIHIALRACIIQRRLQGLARNFFSAPKFQRDHLGTQTGPTKFHHNRMNIVEGHTNTQSNQKTRPKMIKKSIKHVLQKKKKKKKKEEKNKLVPLDLSLQRKLTCLLLAEILQELIDIALDFDLVALAKVSLTQFYGTFICALRLK